MATLKIREFSRLADVYPGGTAPVQQEPGLDQTAFTFSTTTQSAAFAAGTKYILVKSDVAFCYVVGANPIATSNAMDVAANEWVFMGVSPDHKIAVVTA